MTLTDWKKSRLFPQYVKGRLLTTLRVSWYCILISLDKNINFVDFAIVCDSICNKVKVKHTVWSHLYSTLSSHLSYRVVFVRFTQKLTVWPFNLSVLFSINLQKEIENLRTESKNGRFIWSFILFQSFISLYFKPTTFLRSTVRVEGIGPTLSANSESTPVFHPVMKESRHHFRDWKHHCII